MRTQKIGNKSFFSGCVGGISLVFLSLVSSCNTRYLNDGELLYTGAEIRIENDTMGKSERAGLESSLEENLTPKPNASFLGLRPKLYVWNLTKDSKKEKGLSHWLKNKVGEEPVLLSSVDREFNTSIIENYSENKGYFNVRASYDTLVRGKKAKVVYQVKTGPRYRIAEVDFPKDSTKINAEIQKLASKSLLKKGKPFDLDVVIAERERIDSRLKENGFYYFHPDNLIVQADSTVNQRPEVELTVKLKDNVPSLAKRQFTIGNVIVFPDYNIRHVSEGKYRVPANIDSLEVYKDFYIADPEHKFKPRIFDRALYFNKGDIYNRADHNLTLNRLISLGVFKFVKNEFVISDSLRNRFDVYYMLTPREFQSLRVETTGRTNSANYGGGELNLNWTHRNIFRGAEQLKTSLYGAFDMQMGGQRDGNNIFRAGANAQLSIPRLVAPFRFSSSSGFVPRTNVSLGYEYNSRTRLYSLHNFNASFGYLWKENVRKEHDLKVMQATLVYPEKITPEYEAQMAVYPTLRRVVEEQFIFGPTYAYTYTNTMLPKKTTLYYRGMLDLAGNLTGLLMGADAKNGKQKEIFRLPFSQYAKMEHDLRLYHRLSEKQSIAARTVLGIALPYGNSEYMPFSRQFFVGGSNSVRAFRARTLGPGSYDPRTQTTSFFFDQAGDLKLEINAEYRANLYRFLNAAAFVDAGNIWLVNEDPNRPGGKFSGRFMKEIAVGAGLGLRLDFSILILRLDLAVPLRVPYYEEKDRWMFDKIDFGNAAWRRDNLMLNIAIGYPF